MRVLLERLCELSIEKFGKKLTEQRGEHLWKRTLVISRGEAEEIIKETFRKILRDKFKGIFAETALAYADNLIEHDVATSICNFNWKGEWTDAETFVKQADVVGEYNFFSPDVARALVKYIRDRSAKYRLGREKSVVVYVKTNKKVSLDYITKNLGADDVSWIDESTLRIWWD